MYKNEILEEIYNYREDYARSLNYDLWAIFTDLKQKEVKHKKKLTTLSRKTQN